MRAVIEVAEHRRNNKDLPPKNRVWGFRVPARHRIRKSASQVAQAHREIRLTVTITVSGIRDWYINDHLGTPQRMIDGTGTVVWAADYTAFGKATVAGGSAVENNLRFPGQYYDAETGLHYNWNRTYDPQLGRYLSTDPIGINGGDLNLYAYVAGNPGSWSDPFGLDTYRQNRYIGTNIATRSFVSHTFVYTTNPDGTLKHTYSWGNSYVNGKGQWGKDLEEDRSAAQQAIDDPVLLRGLRVGDSSLDDRVDAIYDEWKKDPNSTSLHPHGGVTNNCKTEADKLIDAAQGSLNGLVIW